MNPLNWFGKQQVDNLRKTVALLTDKGFLTRIAVVWIGLMLTAFGIVLLFRKPIIGGAKAVADTAIPG
jgi:hypothetical protein